VFREPKPDPKPIKQAKPKYKKVRKVSEKRRHELEVYKKLRKVYLEENQVCECCKQSKAVQIHHKCGRVGRFLTLWSNFLAVCHNCHEKITRDTPWAIEMGYSEYRNR
jgi:hypothetical protein